MGVRVRVVTPDPAPLALAGVALDSGDGGVAVGQFGTVCERNADGWRITELGFYLDENLHGVWIDLSGGAWSGTVALGRCSGRGMPIAASIPKGALRWP